MNQELSYHLTGPLFRSTMPKSVTGLLISSAIRFIVHILQGNKMLLHLSGSHFLISGDF